MTSTEQAKNALAQRNTDTPSAMVQRYRDDLGSVLPSHVKTETWVRLVVGLLRRDKNLADAAANDPAALMGALMDAARQGLEPGTEQYYLVPRKIKGQRIVQGIRGYQGEVELIYRAGAVSSVIVETVRSNDQFTYVPGRMDRPEHIVDWFGGDRGDLVGAYAYALMRDGAVSKVVVLNADDIAQARATSDGSDSQYSPWQRNPEAMWLKTAAHRLQKWVPTSAEYLREQVRAEREPAPAAEQPVSADRLWQPPPVSEDVVDVAPEAETPPEQPTE